MEDLHLLLEPKGSPNSPDAPFWFPTAGVTGLGWLPHGTTANERQVSPKPLPDGPMGMAKAAQDQSWPPGLTRFAGMGWWSFRITAW